MRTQLEEARQIGVVSSRVGRGSLDAGLLGPLRAKPQASVVVDWPWTIKRDHVLISERKRGCDGGRWETPGGAPSLGRRDVLENARRDAPAANQRPSARRWSGAPGQIGLVNPAAYGWPVRPAGM